METRRRDSTVEFGEEPRSAADSSEAAKLTPDLEME
jgi:hypothetical protein